MLDIGILLLAIVLFTVLAFKGISAVILGPFVGLIVAALSRLPILDTMLGPFMEATAGYVQSYFFVFFLGAVFGAIYEKSGAAKSVAYGIVKISHGKFTASIITLITGLLTLGGISGFVVFFVIYPIALQLFKNNDMSRRLLPGAISAGCWTFSMIAPGSPSIQNVIGINTLGTTATAAFVPGMIGTAFEIIAILLWLEWRTKKLREGGFHFDDPNLRPLPVENEAAATAEVDEKVPNFILSLIPILAIILSFNFFNFKVEAAVFLGIVLAIIFFAKYIKGAGFFKFAPILNDGGSNSISAIMNTSLVVGFGGVVQNTAGFTKLVDTVLSWDMSPLIFVAIAVAICAGAVGSASGGMQIAFNSLKDTFISMGVNLEYVHRIGVIAAGTLDTLPHQGAQITLLNLCHLTHKEGYFDIFITQIAIPVLALFVVIPLCTMGL